MAELCQTTSRQSWRSALTTSRPEGRHFKNYRQSSYRCTATPKGPGGHTAGFPGVGASLFAVCLVCHRCQRPGPNRPLGGSPTTERSASTTGGRRVPGYRIGEWSPPCSYTDHGNASTVRPTILATTHVADLLPAMPAMATDATLGTSVLLKTSSPHVRPLFPCSIDFLPGRKHQFDSFAVSDWPDIHNDD